MPLTKRYTLWYAYPAILVALLCGILLSPVHANFVEIDFRDQNLPTSAFPNHGGPHWIGVVDTMADTLTISYWEELPGSTPYWTPNLANGSLVWPAVDLNGFRYDVPDDFGADPHIGSNWGFVSPVAARQMVWNEGTILLPEVADFYPGWGAVRRPIPGQNPPELYFDTADNQHTMPLLPYSSVGTRPALQAYVTVGTITVVGVPEPSAALFGGVALALMCSRVLYRKCRPHRDACVSLDDVAVVGAIRTE